MLVAFLAYDVSSVGYRGAKAAHGEWSFQRALATKMVSSVRSVYPDATIIQMSDTNSEAIDGTTYVQRLPIMDSLPMDYRLKHLAALPGGDALVLDTDVIVLSDVSEVFQREFDLAICKRGKTSLTTPVQHVEDISKAMPYNTGVMFLRNRNFMWDAYRFCLSIDAGHDSQYREWFGDQLSIAAISHNGPYTTLELPSSIYNNSPGSLDAIDKSAKILHFKGKRKEMMMDLWAQREAASKSPTTRQGDGV